MTLFFLTLTLSTYIVAGVVDIWNFQNYPAFEVIPMHLGIVSLFRFGKFSAINLYVYFD